MKEKTLPVIKVSERLGVSKETVRRWIAEGRLSANQITPGMRGSPWQITEASVVAIEQERQKQRAGVI